MQGRNFVALLQPWSTIISTASYLPLWGKSVIRSMEMLWNGPFSGSVSIRNSAAFFWPVWILFSWQVVHPFMYASMNLLIPLPWYLHFTSVFVLSIPGCSAVRWSWWWARITHHSVSSIGNSIFMNHMSGRRVIPVLSSSPLCSNGLDRKSATLFWWPGQCCRMKL